MMKELCEVSLVTQPAHYLKQKLVSLSFNSSYSNKTNKQTNKNQAQVYKEVQGSTNGLCAYNYDVF